MMTDLSKAWGFIRLRFEVRSPDGGPTARHLMVGSTSAWTIKTRQLRRHQSNNGPWHGHGSFALQVSNFLGLLHGQLLRINFQIGQKAETQPGHRSSHWVWCFQWTPGRCWMCSSLRGVWQVMPAICKWCLGVKLTWGNIFGKTLFFLSYLMVFNNQKLEPRKPWYK